MTMRRFFRCAHNGCGSSVAFQLNAAGPEEISHSGIVGRIHVFFQRHARFPGKSFISLSLNGQRIDGSISPVVDAHPVQGLVHLL